MKNYLKAANWEIFLLTVGLFFIMCYIFFSTTYSYFSASVTKSEQWEIIPQLSQTLIALISIFYVTVALWMFSIVNYFCKKDLKFSLFVLALVCPLIVVVLFAINVYNVQQFGSKIFPAIGLEYVLGFTIALLALFWAIYWFAKVVVTSCDVYAGFKLSLYKIILGVLFFPIGIWKIQPIITTILSKREDI